MRLWTVSIGVLLHVFTVDSTAVNSQKKLRTATRDVDADDDDDDDDNSDVGVPAPAVAAAPAAVVVAAPAVAAAPGPAEPAEPAAQVVAEDTAIQMHEMMEQAGEMFDDHNVSDPRNKHQRALAGLLFLGQVIMDKLDELDDENYAQKIEKEEGPVANETSPGLANMLGEMREEMHEYAIPFYKKFLKSKLKEIEEQQHALVTEIAEEQDGAMPVKEKQVKANPDPKLDSHKSITTNNMMYALALVVVLAAIVFFLSQK